MAQTIPLSRFEKFLARTVVAAYNAKVALMQTTIAGGGKLPIKTGEFVLQINGTLVDDVGGVGLNEIIRRSLNITPESIQITENIEPQETTITLQDPETTTTSDKAKDSELGEDKTAKNTSDESSDNGNETDNSSQTETATENGQTAYGRRISTDNNYLA